MRTLYSGKTTAHPTGRAAAGLTGGATVRAGKLLILFLRDGPGSFFTGLIGDARSLTAGLVISAGVVSTAILPLALAARRAAPAAE